MTGPMENARDMTGEAEGRWCPPPHAMQMVPRRGLLSRLDAVSGMRILDLCAPAGYGKTLFAAQLHDRWQSRGLPVAWLTIDPADAEAGALEQALATAQEKIGVVPPGGSALLVLDGLHLLEPARLSPVLEGLVRRLPAPVRLVLTGRVPVKAGLASLRARGLVLDLRPADLGFDREEMQYLFNHALGPVEQQELEQLTGGWPVAVQFARRWWQRRGDRARLSHLADALADDTADYLEEEVFAPVDAALMADAVRLSVMERLGPEPVHHLLGQDESWYRLLDHPVLGPFLRPLADEQQHFALHPTLALVLRRCFQRLPHGERLALRRRAAAWCQRHGDLIGAVRHAMKAGDADLAAQVVAAAGGAQEIWMRFGYGVIKALDDMLDAAILAAYPRMKLLHALTLLKTGRLTEARSAFEEARRDTRDFTEEPRGGDSGLLRIDALIVESTLLVNECEAVGDGRLALYVDAVNRTARLGPGGGRLVMASAKTAICISRAQQGQFDDALAASAEAMDLYRRLDCVHGQFYHHLHLAGIHGARGQPLAVEESIAAAQGIAKRHLTDDPGKEKLIAALSADIAYERDQIALAHRRLRQVGDTFNEEAWFDILAAMHGTSAMVALASGGADAALGRLEAAAAEVARRQLPSLQRFLDALRISCLVLAGRGEDALSLYGRVGMAPDMLDSLELWREREAVLLAYGRLAMLRREPERVLEMTAAVMPGLRLADNKRSLIRLGALAALAADAAAQPDQAAAHLRETLLLSADTGFRRIFREEGDAMLALLERFAATGGEGEGPAGRHARALLTDLTARPDGDGALALLTGAERKVLAELQAGHPDKVIARNLSLTLNTVKFHVKNIYAKLGVTGRAGLAGLPGTAGSVPVEHAGGV
ncbi:LuxR C-terminal-related transcriptional regulator [Niveispirillum fermenti]|uniref:LuxR C-terminal-related transcriptional regulator n=1 Tax=Niveispirillum fermenti TaxID=1233113 RepID=UPI003A857AE2